MELATCLGSTGRLTRALHRALTLPPRSPELNPVENVWQYLRDNYLSNRVFASRKQIVDLCCYAWNQLTDRPWTIMSVGYRKWAHEF